MMKKKSTFMFLFCMAILFIVACNENVSEKESSVLSDSIDHSFSIPYDCAYSFSKPINNDTLRQKELARYNIIDAETSGKDVSLWAISEGAMTIFYSINGDIYMANVSPKKNSQSWGKIFIFDTCRTQTESSIIETLHFRWQFYNSYDSIKGFCRSEFSQKKTPSGTFSILKILVSPKDTIIYRGYMENSIDPLKLFN